MSMRRPRADFSIRFSHAHCSRIWQPLPSKGRASRPSGSSGRKRPLWIIGNRLTDTFPKRIEREPRCAIGIVDFDLATGLVQHVGFRGRAHLEPHDEERIKRLLRRYLGEQEQPWDPRFAAVLGDRDWVLVRFEPETAVVRDQSYRVNNDRPA